MRIIDADDLIKKVKESNKHHANNSRDKELLDRIVRIIEEQKTLQISITLPTENRYMRDYLTK